MFRLQATKIKETLSQDALKIRNLIIEAANKWCNDTVTDIDLTFKNMTEKIRGPPVDEKKLVEIREYIKEARDVIQIKKLEELKEVIKH